MRADGWRRHPDRDAAAASAALIDLVSRHGSGHAPVTTFDAAAAGHLAALAEKHRLAGLVARRLRELDLDPGPEVTARLEEVYRLNVARQLLLGAELAGLSRTLEGLRRPWLVVKGPVIGERLYGDPGARGAVDLDVVVCPRDYRAAVEAIEADGGQVVQRNWPLLRDLGLGQIVLTLRGGLQVDLHWDLLNTPAERARFSLSTEEMRERSRTVHLRSAPVRTLDPTDTVLHLCVHSVLSGGHLLVWLEDLERAVAVDPPDWDSFVERARRYRLGLACAVALGRAARTLGVALPDGMLRALAPRDLLPVAVAAHDAAAGPALWSGRRRTLRTLLRFIAADDRATLAALSRHAAGDVVVPVLRARHLLPARVESLVSAAGGDSERRRYFDSVPFVP